MFLRIARMIAGSMPTSGISMHGSWYFMALSQSASATVALRPFADRPYGSKKAT